MRLILLGAPGSGKGTVAKLLIEKYGVPQISTGDILRSAVNSGSEIGKKAADYMKRGDLVPDSVIMDIMEARLQEEDCKEGYILDGFPRTIPQAESLTELLKKIGQTLDMVANLEVPEDEIIRRLTSRRTCSNAECQAIYNVISFPTKVEGICDKCGSPVIQRDDETEEAIRNRLSVYEEKTAPLASYYEKQGNLVSIRALKSQEVFEEIVKNI